MSNKTKKNKVGRPRHNINWSTVEQLLAAHCTGTEVAETLGIHPDTLYNQCKEEHGMSFTDYSARKRQKGTTALKVKMFEQALGRAPEQKGVPNLTMLIWLSKNYMGFSDRSENIIGIHQLEDSNDNDGFVIVLPANNR